jgi:hypothetical protein
MVFDSRFQILRLTEPLKAGEYVQGKVIEGEMPI